MCGIENIASWQNRNIPGATQRLGDTKGEVGVVQILNEVLARCNKKTTTVARRRYDKDARRLCGRVWPNE